MPLTPKQIRFGILEYFLIPSTPILRMWLMMIFCEHSWPLLRCLWKRIYSPLITGVFAHQSNIFAPTFLRNNQRWCKKSASHLYSSSMSLWSTSGFCYLRPQRMEEDSRHSEAKMWRKVGQNNETSLTQLSTVEHWACLPEILVLTKCHKMQLCVHENWCVYFS